MGIGILMGSSTSPHHIIQKYQLLKKANCNKKTLLPPRSQKRASKMGKAYDWCKLWWVGSTHLCWTVKVQMINVDAKHRIPALFSFLFLVINFLTSGLSLCLLLFVKQISPLNHWQWHWLVIKMRRTWPTNPPIQLRVSMEMIVFCISLINNSSPIAFVGLIVRRCIFSIYKCVSYIFLFITPFSYF